MSQDSPDTPPPAEVPAPTPATKASRELPRVAALLFALALLAYLPALFAGFIWDDAGHVTRAELQSFSGLARIWTEPGATQQFYPLLHSAFWIEHRLFGDSPAGYHLINVLLHAGGALLFFRLLRTLAIPGALLAAVLFLLHPVCVESVAWVSEQKNTLSLVFYLAAALSYLRFEERRSPAGYALATLLFIAALLSKTTTATLPAALLVVLWWRRGHLTLRGDILPLLPWFALGIASGLTTAWMEHHFIGATGDDFALGTLGRLLLAGRAIWFYASKLLWPVDLAFIYPRWSIAPATWWQWLFPAAALALLAALFAARKHSRAPLAVALLFGGTLFPALGFFDVFPFTYSFVADHFQYLASLAVFALAGALLHTRLARLGSAIPWLGGGILAAVLGVMTASQTLEYRDSVTLYEATLRRNPACWMAHNNLGIELLSAGEAERALDHFLTALNLRDKDAETASNVGDALNRLGRPHEAVPYLQKAIVLRPDFGAAHLNLGVSYMNIGRLTEGVAEFRKATELSPKSALAHFNLAQALAGIARITEAKPDSARVTEALTAFEQALALDPSYHEAHLSYAMTLGYLGRLAEARPHFEKAIALQPESARTLYCYGRLLNEKGESREAVAHLRKALKLEPGTPGYMLQLATALRQSGNPEEALFFEREAARQR